MLNCRCLEVKKIGEFVNIFHDIGGTVFALDDKTIVVKDFNYDGEGPDAFFLAGTSGRPNKRGEVNTLMSPILPYLPIPSPLPPYPPLPCPPLLPFPLPSPPLPQVILPYPGSDKTFSYSDKDIPILGRSVCAQ